MPGISPYLQPIAHALLQARDEVTSAVDEFPDHLLWEKPASLASPGFHLQHLTGVIDRLFTYAKGDQLTEEQLSYLKSEGSPAGEKTSKENLLVAFQQKVEQAIEELKILPEESLIKERGVGRKQLPSTVLGLLFHSAEHTMRHTGQLLVTLKVLMAKE